FRAARAQRLCPVSLHDALPIWHLQMSAERRRRATVTEAEGNKAAAIAQAQGQKESAILNAQGDKEAAILRAQGESRSIELVLNSMGEGEKSSRAVIGYLLGQS